MVEEIVSTINNKLGSFKAEIGHDIELQKIQLEDNKTNVEKLKVRIKDLETIKRCFNESDLFASSVDLTRTPMRLLQGQLRTPQRLAASPIPEAESEDLLSSQMTSREGSHCSTPRNVNNEDDGDHDVTLYEDICSEKKKATDSRARTISSGLGQNPLEKQILLKSLLRGKSGRRPFLIPKIRMMIKFTRSLNQSDVVKRKEESRISAIYLSI